jgi:hypothetical protein
VGCGVLVCAGDGNGRDCMCGRVKRQESPNNPFIPPNSLLPLLCSISRLTQNVIDGFGVSGVEGVFRRVCEITLAVLRQHKGSILR